MADETRLVAGKSPEEVALVLFDVIAKAEGKSLGSGPGASDHAGRKWVLKTYAECLSAVRDYRLLVDD